MSDNNFDSTACAHEVLAERTAEIRLVVAVALIDHDGRVLITKRPAGKDWAGFWEFPGGKVEQNETPEAALKREIKEELNIKTDLGCFAPLTFASHHYDDFHLLMPFYICRIWSGRAQGIEGQELKWVFVNQLKDYQLLPANKPLIPILRDWL